jgi:hypothetical protein
LHKLNKTIDQKKRQANSLSENYENKIKQHQWFYDEQAKAYDVSFYENAEFLWHELEEIHHSDSIEYKFNKVWDKVIIEVLNKLGFTNSAEFNEFVSANIITQTDMRNFREAKAVREEISNLYKDKRNLRSEILSLDEQINFGYKTLFVILILLYPVRYLFLLVRWSFQTIKQKDE